MIRLYRMDCLYAIKLFAVLMFVHATSGQTITVSGPSRAANGTNVSFTCTLSGETSDQIQWVENVGGTAVTIYNGQGRFSQSTKYLNFKVTSLTLTESVMTIEKAEVEDDGGYTCNFPSGVAESDINLVVEAPSTLTVTLNDTVINNVDFYVATCDAVEGKPQETLTWTLDGIEPTNGNGNTIEVTHPSATAPLFTTKSMFTFPATLENYGQILDCIVSGHEITELNGQKSENLTIHTSPSAANTTVAAEYKQVTQGTGIIVSCITKNQPRPVMRNYYIFSNGTLIYESMEGGNEVTVEDPEEGIQYTCIAGNYLGNTTLSEAEIYDPSKPEGLSAGAVAGIVIGVIACIVIIIVVILYLVKPECCPCFATAGLKSSGSGKKPAGSAVGSSNGSEKDKINQPVAAQRSQAPIQHTASNPGQELYALPERKQPAGGRGGDAPDRGSGPGQNEPQGMLYADLDLSSKAGHTEKHIPKNENDVVVYSSILV